MKIARLIPMLCLTLCAIASVVVTAPLSGCKSQPQAFHDASDPMTSRVIADFTSYAEANPDDTAKSSDLSRVQAFANSIAIGDSQGAAMGWFGEGHIRDNYVKYLNADAKYKKPGGPEALAIRMNNLNAIDYIISVGKKQTDK